MATGQGINGAGVAIAAAGLVLSLAGFNNVNPIVAFKDLAMGKPPTPNRKKAFEPVGFDAGSSGGGAVGAAGGSVVSMAEQVAKSPAGRKNYRWSGGHCARPCECAAKTGFDCSGYVSCVLNRLGLLKGAKNTVQFLAWKGAATVPFKDRQPGDLLVTADHIGIAIDGKKMWNAACTKCGAVKVSPYGSKYTVRRVKGAATSGTPRRHATDPLTMPGKCMSKGWNNGRSPGDCASTGDCRWDESSGCWVGV